MDRKPFEKAFYAGLGVPEDADIGLKLIRAAAQEGCEEAATYFLKEASQSK